MRRRAALIFAVVVVGDAAACNLLIGLEHGVPEGSGGSSSASASSASTTSSTGGGASSSSSAASSSVASSSSSGGGCLVDDAGPPLGCDRTWPHWPVTKPASLTVMDTDAVLDGKTSLIWQLAKGPQRDWQGALDYCSALQLAGRCDWRLPTRIELATIVDYTVSQANAPMIHSPLLAAAGDYWTASPSAGNATEAWHVNFKSGLVASNISKILPLYVRCVH